MSNVVKYVKCPRCGDTLYYTKAATGRDMKKHEVECHRCGIRLAAQ